MVRGAQAFRWFIESAQSALSVTDSFGHGSDVEVDMIQPVHREPVRCRLEDRPVRRGVDHLPQISLNVAGLGSRLPGRMEFLTSSPIRITTVPTMPVLEPADLRIWSTRCAVVVLPSVPVMPITPSCKEG